MNAGLGPCWAFPVLHTGGCKYARGILGAAQPGAMDLTAQWQEVPDTLPTANPFRQCWEAFLRHVAEDAP